MPEHGDSEYPPQFASSDLSSLLGQINDFAGVPPPPPPPGPSEMASAKALRAESAPLVSGARAPHMPVPVSIVGSQAQRGPYLPWLKDILIGTTYLRLAEQITSSDQKATAQKLAYELIVKGTAGLNAHAVKQLKNPPKKR
jgi:hypothetical protein